MHNFIQNHLKILKKNNFKYPELELRTLLNNSSIESKNIILSNFQIKQINLNIFVKAFERRLKKEPLAKIFNKKYFWNYKFFVNNKVLDPRPESEHIIEAVINYFQNSKKKLKILDLGTGSGCLAITLSKEYPNSIITATDISKEAISVAKKNSLSLDVNQQIKFIVCDWLKTFEIFDIVIANPPYLKTSEYNKISKKYNHSEPEIALNGGQDGLDCYRKLAKIIPNITHNNSLCFLEIGYNQKTECIKLFSEFGMNCIDFVRDYQKYTRVLILKKNKY